MTARVVVFTVKTWTNQSYTVEAPVSGQARKFMKWFASIWKHALYLAATVSNSNLAAAVVTARVVVFTVKIWTYQFVFSHARKFMKWFVSTLKTEGYNQFTVSYSNVAAGFVTAQVVVLTSSIVTQPSEPAIEWKYIKWFVSTLKTSLCCQTAAASTDKLDAAVVITRVLVFTSKICA